MHRWAACAFILSYLSVLAFGLASHALTFLKSCHPAMYFIVWDMFAGWAAYEQRIHVIGEGDSGAYYSLESTPWGEFHPYSAAAARHDYDIHGQFGFRYATNTLAHTQHEPIRRILVVEESWPKKFNLPEPLWRVRYKSDKPVQPSSYFHTRRVYNGSGQCLQQYKDFLNTQFELAVMDNPRLRSDIHKGQKFMASRPGDRSGSAIQHVGFESQQR